MLRHSDWRSMGSHIAAFPGMFARDLSSPLIDIIVARRLKWQHIQCIILLYGCLSSHSTLQQVTYRRCGSSSHTQLIGLVHGVNALLL